MTITRAVKDEALRLGFALAGVTTPAPPPHLSVFENWLSMGRHASMNYMRDPRRRDPLLVLPGCKSILVLAVRYPNPGKVSQDENPPAAGRVAAYAWGDDYHFVLPDRLKQLVVFIETLAGNSFQHRCTTDSAPLLERDLAQRAGLGWIGKNTCLIHPTMGSYFLLAEILLGIELEADQPFTADRCGRCTRCISACPTGCILPDRTLDARRCLSYLTIENRQEIPVNLRRRMGNRIFGCDICQQVCPWNRFADQEYDPLFKPRNTLSSPELRSELSLSPQDFDRKFTGSPILRSKRRGYLRNVAVALGNSRDCSAVPDLEKALHDPEPLVHEHAGWALEQIRSGERKQDQILNKILLATNNPGKILEIKALLVDLSFALLTPADLGLVLEVPEDGESYADNSAKKAVAFAKASGLTALGDDSGLEVDALGGLPGLHSHRFSPDPDASDADRRKYLLERLSDKPRPWTARFRATVAIALPSGEVRLATGECEGEIVPVERGSNGFGYDPIFLIPGLGRTMAELGMNEKNRLSHRALAVRNAIPILKELLD